MWHLCIKLTADTFRNVVALTLTNFITYTLKEIMKKKGNYATYLSEEYIYLQRIQNILPPMYLKMIIHYNRKAKCSTIYDTDYFLDVLYLPETCIQSSEGGRCNQRRHVF